MLWKIVSVFGLLGLVFKLITSLKVLFCFGVFAVTGLDKLIAVFSVGAVCTFYTTVVSLIRMHIYRIDKTDD